eukprot:s2043_g10.t1
MCADGKEQVRLDIRALSGKQILEVSIARNSTGEELHRLVNEEGTSLAFQWQLVHRNAPLKMGPLEFTDGEARHKSTDHNRVKEWCAHVHPLKCGEFRLPKYYQKVADASFGKDCTVQAHMSRASTHGVTPLSDRCQASNVNVIRMWDAFIVPNGESKHGEVVTVFETMDVTLEKFLSEFARLGDLNCCLAERTATGRVSPVRSVPEQLDILQNREQILEDSKVPSNRKNSLQTLWEENPGRRGTAAEFIKSDPPLSIQI